jgi:transposase-like protein
LTGEACCSVATVVSTPLGVRRVPVPGRGDRAFRRDAAAARRFFSRALRALKVTPSEVVTDAAPVYPAVLAELVPSAWHRVEQYANNRIEADHGQLERRRSDLTLSDRAQHVHRSRNATEPGW